ncbi:hypothetical protein [Reichenbachiella agariperforans]|uniref:hypothetical protein n=1 Tax=Reichenbachiella agariperforans TaxID=156994 RepID=UPI001C086AC0|nr:hypothetical protein [Reichenbachiella agariperforans]MBU2914841.1 hypothetical protein [Reichenbachiella agariperforans]
MKSVLGIVVLMLTVNLIQAQPGKVREKDLDGVWQLKIDLGDDFLEEEIDDEDNAMARVIMQATGSFVDGILDEVDIRFEFLDGGECKIYVSAFGSDPEIETGKWSINKKGQLLISDTDSYQSDGDEYWMMEDDILIAMEDGEILEEDAHVYLVRID